MAKRRPYRSRESRLPVWRRDALDEQDKQLELGRWEMVLCRNGKIYPKWMLGLFAAEREAREAELHGIGFNIPSLAHGPYAGGHLAADLAHQAKLNRLLSDRLKQLKSQKKLNALHEAYIANLKRG